MDNNLNAAYDACNSFNNKLRDTIMGLINANTERKKEIDGLRADHDKLRQDHNSFESSATRENDLRYQSSNDPAPQMITWDGGNVA